MRSKVFLMLSGAAGIVLAALIYFLALRVQGLLSFLVLLPSLGFVLLYLLLFVSLVEIAAMTYGLRRLAPGLPGRMLYLFAAGYVAFASVYAFVYALLVPDPTGILLLASLCVVRWLTLLFLHPVSQTK